jgi:hypothetical protein
MLWALIINGIVFEITATNPAGRFPPDMEWVSCASSVLPGFTYNGSAFAAPAAPSVTPAAAAAAQYAAAIAAGLAVTSTGTPTLDGVYGIEPSDVSDIMAEVQFIAAFAEFTNTTTTMLLWTQQGSAVPVAFISTAQFMSFAKQAAQYVAACKLAADTVAAGGTATWPSNAATIP